MATLNLLGYVSSEFGKIRLGNQDYVSCIFTCEKGSLTVPVYFDYYVAKMLKRFGVRKGYLLNLTLELKSDIVITTSNTKKIRIAFNCQSFEVIQDTITKIPSTDYLDKLLALETLGHLKSEIKKEKKKK